MNKQYKIVLVHCVVLIYLSVLATRLRACGTRLDYEQWVDVNRQLERPPKGYLREQVILAKDPYNESWYPVLHNSTKIGLHWWWREWIDYYMVKVKAEATQTEPDIYTDLPDPPLWWDVEGTGYKGVNGNVSVFPPWANTYINYGIPSFCYQLPESSNDCPPGRGTVLRFFYNPFIDNCVGFHYRCRGNRNNFKDRIDCYAVCVTGKDRMRPGCDHDSGVKIQNNPFKDIMYG